MSNIIKSILNWITGAAKKVKEALTFGKEFANEVKQVVDSPILDVITTLIPGTLDDKALAFVRMGISSLVSNLGWADKKVSDFTYKSLPHVLNTISAEAATLKAEYDKIQLSRQQAIASAQVVYSPEILK